MVLLALTSIIQVAVVAIVLESFRRSTHPHVWLLNGPVLLWCAIDALCRMLWRR